MTRRSTDRQPAIDKAMRAWNAMTPRQRRVALVAANTARPAQAMRHFGHPIPEHMPATRSDNR